MAQVKVWNDNTYDYSEDFRENKIRIKAKSFIYMDAEEAHLFKCNFAPIRVDADGNATPDSYKMIRIETVSGEEPVKPEAAQAKFVCQLDGAEFESQADLDAYISENYKDRIVVDSEAEKAVAEKKRAKKSA
jgi:hypothetical protein